MANTNDQIKHETLEEAEGSMHTKINMSMHMQQDYNMTYGDQHKIMSATQAMHPVPHGATFLTGYFATNDPSNYPSQHMPNLSTAQDPHHEHLHHPGTKTVPPHLQSTAPHQQSAYTAPFAHHQLHQHHGSPFGTLGPSVGLPNPSGAAPNLPSAAFAPQGAPPSQLGEFSHSQHAPTFAFEPTNPFAPDSDPANLDLLRRTGHGDLPGVGYGGYGAPAYPPHYHPAAPHPSAAHGHLPAPFLPPPPVPHHFLYPSAAFRLPADFAGFTPAGFAATCQPPYAQPPPYWPRLPCSRIYHPRRNRPRSRSRVD